MTEAPAAGGDLTPVQVAMRHKWMILLIAVLAACGTAGWLSTVPSVYVAEADVRLDMPQVRISDERNSVLGGEQVTPEQIRTELVVLSSPRLALNAVKTLGLQDLRAFQECPAVSRLQSLRDAVDRLRGRPVAPPECKTSPEYAAGVLLGSLSFSTGLGAYIIQIMGSATDPALAARIANGYADAYIAWQGEMKSQLAEQADRWLSADLASMQTKMLADDAAVETYRQKHHLVGLHPKVGGGDGTSVDTVATQRLAQQNGELNAISASLTEKTSVLAQIQKALNSGQFETIPSVLNAPLIQGMLARQADLQNSLAEMRANYGPTYPKVVAAAAALDRGTAQIRVEADKIIRSLNDEVAALAARKAAVAGQLEAVETQVAGESQAAVDLAELQRSAETDRRLYENLFVRLKQVDAERRMAQASVAVIVEATPPDSPTYPRKRMMIMGAFLAAIGVGVGVAFAREMLSRRFRDSEQVEGEIGLPVIGIFARRRQAPQDIVIDQPLSIEAEAVHGVLTHLLDRPEAGEARLGKVVMVTSALPGEGKSCFSVALARSAVRSGMSAFVLDCDLRRPMVEQLLAGGKRDAVTPAPGTATPDMAEMIATMIRRAGVDERSGLRYLSFGDYVANPHGLIAWPGLVGTLQYLRTRYDLILLDTPPVLAVSDALRLGGLADDVVLTIDWTSTPRQAVTAAVRALQRAQVAVTGLVMTKVNLRRYAGANTGEGFYLRHYRGYQRAIDSAA